MNFFPLALRLQATRVALVGEHPEGADKLQRLRAAGASVVWFAPSLPPALQARAARGEFAWFARDILPHDVAGCRLVVLLTHSDAAAAQLRTWCREHDALLCALDQTEYCDWIHMSLVTRGPLTLALSSDAQAPGLLLRMRRALERDLDPEFGQFVARFAQWRATLSGLDPAERKRRIEAALRDFDLALNVRLPAWAGDPEASPYDSAATE